MAESIKCNKCGRIYTDKGSIDMAKDNADGWREDCERDGVQATGLFPCPEMECTGEMVLIA